VVNKALVWPPAYWERVILAPAVTGGTSGEVLTSTGPSTAATFQPAQSAINFVINGGGAAIATGTYVGPPIPFACTITGVTVGADQSASTVVDIWIALYANYPPTISNSITAADKPTLSSAEKYQDTTLAGWTTAIAANSAIWYDVTSNNNAEQLSITLAVNKT